MVHSLHTQEWRLFGVAPGIGAFTEAQVIAPDKILIFGGLNRDLASSYSYIIDAHNENVVATNRMNVPRWATASVVMADGMVYALGGYTSPWYESTSTIERYDPKTGSWSVVGDLCRSRAQIAAVALNDSLILVVGGRIGESEVVDVCEIFNINTFRSLQVSSFPHITSFSSIARLSDSTAIAFAGRVGGPNSFRSNKVFQYSLGRDTWEVVGLTDSLYYPTITTIGTEIFWTGGSTQEGRDKDQFTDHVSRFKDGTFQRFGTLNETRCGHGAAKYIGNTLIVVGGANNVKGVRASCEFVDLASGVCTQAPQLNVGRAYFKAVRLDHNESVKIFAIGGVVDDGWTITIEVLEPDCATASGKIVPNDFTLRGHSFQRADSIVLTPSETFTRGAAWLKKKVVLSSGLDIQFGFRLNGGADNDLKDGGPEGADGIALVLQNRDPQPLGETGRGIGYDMTPHGIAVEFDAYMNGAFADPSPSHVAVQGGDGTRLRGVHEAPYLRAVAHQGVPNFVANGQEYHARILYDNGLLQVWVDTTSSFNNPVISIPLNLSSEVGTDGSGTAWLGFTSATGFAQQEHVLTYVSLNSCEALVTHVQEFTPNVSLHVVPQPAHTEVLLQFGRALPEGAELSVYDVTGTLVLREDVGNMFSKAVHVQHLPSGTYGFQITALHSIMSASTFTVMR